MLAALATLSLLIQLANVALVLRLIATTGRRTAWLFIAAAMILAALLRLVMVLEFYVSRQAPTTATHEVLVVIVSTLLAIGLYLIRPLLDSIRAAERAVGQSEAQYRALVVDSPLSVVVCREGHIEYANRTAMAMFHADRLEQLVHRPLVDFVHLRHHALVTEQLKSINEAHPSQPITEIQLVGADGQLVDAEVLVALFVYGGNLAQYIILWDVSERKRREEALRDRESELAHVMRLHTMGEIAAEMAHEINQPLYAISNFAQAGIMHLQSGEPQRLSQLQTCLEHAHTQAAHAAQIVKNLRNFVSKTEAEYRQVSFNPLVRDALELVAAESRRKRANVELALGTHDALIQANPVQIQQVLVNLLINAFEAMEALPERDRRVRVVTCVDSDRVELAVEDRGPGIPEENLSRVFEPFFTSKPQGMGMGLAVTRTIVINHGGKIWAERNQQGGTTFRVSLPRT